MSDTAPAKIKHHTQIIVSQEEIDHAQKGNSGHCMIQQAIKHSNANTKLVSVDLQTIRWTDRRNGIRYVWLTPFTAQQALLQFDQGIRIRPFTFRLASHPIAHTEDGHIASPESGRTRKSRSRKGRVKIRHSGKGSISVTTEGRPLPGIAALPGNRRRFGIKQMNIGLYDKYPSKKAKR